MKSLLILFAFANTVYSQDKGMPQAKVTVDVNNKSLRDILLIIEQQIPYKFAYNSELIEKQKHISIDVENKSLEEVFPILLKRTNLTYSMIDNQIILNEVTVAPQITISGYVKDSITGETLPGAIIYLPEKKIGTYANDYGFFSITQSQTDSLDMWISYIGFNNVCKRVNAVHNSNVNFYLSNKSYELKSVLITDKRDDDNLRKDLPGSANIPLERVNAIPAISGNGDIINSIRFLPGVMAGLDGRPGYFIRGGNTDQNLVQLDEVTLYNPDHLLGLVGIFNSSAIKSAHLLKAGFPASFGDHLSSVLDVTMKDGNEREFNEDFQAGTIATGFTLSGPLAPNRASFLFAARRSTIDLLLKPFKVSDYYSNYYFYDVNAKLNLKLTPKDRLYISFYQGRDNSSYTRDTATSNDIHYQVNYGNRALTFRWNHLFSQKLFSNTSLSYNNYFHQVNARQQEYFAELYSGIRDMEFKSDLNYYPNTNHKISAGVNYLFQTLYPASVTDKGIIPETVNTISPSEIPQKHSGRLAAYFGDEILIGNRFMTYIGARVPFFYNKNSKYLRFEPRLALMYLINQTTSAKISYTHMHQYLHLVQSYNSSFPAQVWIGSSDFVKPQFGREASVGLFKNFKDNMFQSSIEVYYKKMENQLMFRGGLNNAIDSDLENTLIFGEGKSYGTEIFVGKNKGNFTGWVAYTLAYSTQKFDSLNFGKRFPFSNDRRHNLSLTLNYSMGRHWEFASNFLFSSGSAFTVFKYISPNKWTNDNPLYYYSGDRDNGEDDETYISGTRMVQNNVRLAPYHRLDLSVSYRNTRSFFNRTIETRWVFSVYNVYARENTFFAYCSIDPVSRKPIAVEVSFVPIIPSISYNVKF